MGTIKEQEELEELRRRLYSRGQQPTEKPKEILQPKPPSDIKKTWRDIVPAVSQAIGRPLKNTAPVAPQKPTPLPTAPGEPTPPVFTPPTDAMPQKKRSKKYRWYLLLIGLVVFVMAAGISSYIFWTGSNTISGENITLEINGPLAVGGGETLALQVGVSNQNAVPINAAVLVLSYPSGTQSAGDQGGSLSKERIELNTIKSGESVNVPVKAVVFGEENESKIITAAIEYRVEGSNATFYKEATPLEFKISSSPLVLDVEAIDALSSGQEITFDVTVRSNTASPVSGVLLVAEYPAGFEFLRANPTPASRDSVWRINEIPPEGEITISVTGTITGNTTEAQTFSFDVGTASDRNSLTFSSVLTTAAKTVEIEQPFIALGLEINGKTGSSITLEPDEEIDAVIDVANTLSVAIYDVRAEVALSGNAFTPNGVNDERGFFNSANDTVSWNATNIAALSQIRAGDSETVSFGLRPVTSVTSPVVTMSINVYGKRIQAETAAEVLIGTAEATVQFSSSANLISSAGRNSSLFNDRGPIPPVVSVDTTYTLAFRAEAGNNGVSDSSVTATLPSYVTWLNQTTGDGIVNFNPVSREVTWQIGDIRANAAATAAFQVSLTPSLSQVGSAPALMSGPQFRGTDKFTGDVLRSSARPVTTELSTESGFEERNGTVVGSLIDSANFNQNNN